MGSGRFDPTDWDAYSTSKSYSTKSTSAIFTSRKLDADLDPKNINP
jgi:hypothetical protein